MSISVTANGERFEAVREANGIWQNIRGYFFFVIHQEKARWVGPFGTATEACLAKIEHEMHDTKSFSRIDRELQGTFNLEDRHAS